MKDIECLKKIIKESGNICVFTGAGISCPSGIPDFRSADGLYNDKGTGRYSPEEIISHSFFVSYPDMFYKFYKEKMIYPEAVPNAAHKYFAELENEGKTVNVVTQNIDGLHQKAGSRNVFELHGSVLRNNCTKCGKFYGVGKIVNSDGIPLCDGCGGIIKPDVVLYEEPLDNNVVNNAVKAISAADTLIVIGTSLVVYPAASYVRYFGGENLILINKTPTEYDSMAKIAIYDDIINVVAALKGEN